MKYPKKIKYLNQFQNNVKIQTIVQKRKYHTPSKIQKIRKEIKNTKKS